MEWAQALDPFPFRVLGGLPVLVVLVDYSNDQGLVTTHILQRSYAGARNTGTPSQMPIAP